jgi:hypothetical protein
MMDSKDKQRKDKGKFCNLKPGRSADESWVASKVQVVMAEKHDQRSDGTTNDSGLMYAQVEGTATASHFTGHQKVTHVVPH